MFNRYRIDGDKYIFHTFSQGQQFNSSVWLENDEKFIKKNIGTEDEPIMVYATYYNSDGTIDTDKELELANENIKTIAESAKAEALDKLTVTTESGKVFYADSASRIDLQGAITSAELKGITEKPWKLAEPIDGQKIVIVTLDEIKEAVFLALEAKGAIVLDETV